MPRLYREAPLYSIWEGAGNVQALDVLRAAQRTPAAVDVFLDEVEQTSGGDARLDVGVNTLRDELGDTADAELRARALSGLMAVVLQASLLVRHAPSEVADAYCATRLRGAEGGHPLFGTLPRGLDLEAILARTTPQPS